MRGGARRETGGGRLGAQIAWCFLAGEVIGSLLAFAACGSGDAVLHAIRSLAVCCLLHGAAWGDGGRR